MGTGDLPGVKRPGREADHSSPCYGELKMRGTVSPLPHTSSWRGSGNLQMSLGKMKKMGAYCEGG